TNLLYVGTGNPAPWIADMRRGENLYTMSAVALDVDSGKMKWYHQYLANEPWDFDTMAEHHVIDVVRGGQTHKAVVQANKLGYVADLTYRRGQLYTGVTVEHFSKAEQAGVLRAFDVNQNKVAWEWSNRTPLISHTLSTGGDLVFQGTAEGMVVALDAKSGRELWSFSLGTPQSGGIMSYAVDGKQYVAVAAGGTLRSQVWFGTEPKW